MRRVLAAAAVLLAAVSLWFGTRRGAPAPGPAGGELVTSGPVVLVVVDTLRADRLGAYGHRGSLTPALDAFARDAVVFEDAYSHVPLTLPAHASLFTGLLPPRHGVRDNGGFALDARHRTLATRFREAGMETGGAVSAWVLRRATGIAAGFDFYDDAIETDEVDESIGDQQRDGGVAVDSLAGWIEARAGRRFFAFLHLYEPHSPWAPPPPHRGRPTPYDGDVAHADELVGRFLDRLRAGGVLDRAVVVITSDHGEGLGDHGEEEHGLFLYREALRVPLLVRLPRAERGGTRVARPVAQSDVAATLLDLAGLPHEGLDGVSLRAALSGRPLEDRPVYSETLFPRYHFGWSELLAVTEGRLRYVDAPRPELYDVAADPGERLNLVASRAAAATAMRSWARARAGGKAPAPAPVPDDVRERLEALGYVGGGAPPPPSGPRPDPKDEIGAFEAFKAAVELQRQGRAVEAAAALRRVVADRPGMVDARETLAHVLVVLGRAREAAAELEAVIEVDPDRASAHLALARVYGTIGRLERVERHAARAVAQRPGEAYEMLAQLALDRGREDEAARFARHAVEADPSRAVAHFVLGLVARAAGRCDEALPSLRRAEEERSRKRSFVMPGLMAATAECLARAGRDAEAERAFAAEITGFPASVEGRVGLAILYRSRGLDDRARDVLAGVVRSHPSPGPEQYWVVVRTLRGLDDAPAAVRWAAEARSRFPSDPRFR